MVREMKRQRHGASHGVGGSGIGHFYSLVALVVERHWFWHQNLLCHRQCFQKMPVPVVYFYKLIRATMTII